MYRRSEVECDYRWSYAAVYTEERIESELEWIALENGDTMFTSGNGMIDRVKIMRISQCIAGVVEHVKLP